MNATKNTNKNSKLSAKEYYELGQLNNAIEAITAEVKKKPTDINRRGFLCELLFIKRAWERADKQLDFIGHQDPNSMHMVALWRQLLRAGQARDQFYLEGRIPEVLEEPGQIIEAYLKAAVAIREGKLSEAYTILNEAESNRPEIKGQLNGKDFSDFRDLQDISPSVLEVLTSTGKYYWIPFSRISSLEFHAVEGPMDLVFRRATLETNKEGPDGEVFIPAIYHAVSMIDEERQLMGRATDWLGGTDEPVTGAGQKMFLVDDRSISIMEIESLRFQERS